MDEVLALIQSLADQISDEPSEVLSDHLLQAEASLSQRAEEPKAPTHQIVESAIPLENLRELATPAELMPKPQDSKEWAQPHEQPRDVGVPVEILQRPINRGGDAMVISPDRVVAATANIFLKERIDSEQAQPQERLRAYTQTIDPERKVQYLMPGADEDFDFVNAFAQFDARIQIPSVGADNEIASALPELSEPGPEPISSEQLVADSMTRVLQSDNMMDRMGYL